MGWDRFIRFSLSRLFWCLNPEKCSRIASIDMILRCIQFFVKNASRSDVCAKAAAILEPMIRMTTQQPPMADGGGNRTYHEVGESEASLADDAVWGSFPELEDLFYGVPPEQWLMPSVSLWNASPTLRNNFALYPKG